MYDSQLYIQGPSFPELGLDRFLGHENGRGRSKIAPPKPNKNQDPWEGDKPNLGKTHDLFNCEGTLVDGGNLGEAGPYPGGVTS